MRNTTQLLTAAALLALAASISAQPATTSNPPPTQLAKHFQFKKTESITLELSSVPAQGIRRQGGEALAADSVFAWRGRARHRMSGKWPRTARPRTSATHPDFPFIVVSPQCPEHQIWSRDALLALLDDITAKLRGGHEPDLPDRAEHGGLRHVGPGLGPSREVCGHRADLRRRPDSSPCCWPAVTRAGAEDPRRVGVSWRERPGRAAGRVAAHGGRFEEGGRARM